MESKNSSDLMCEIEENSNYLYELSVTFGYQCNTNQGNNSDVIHLFEISDLIQIQDSKSRLKSKSFSCLSGAALSANATLTNTNICNGLIGEGILPGLDSPKSFKKMTSLPSFLKMDHLQSSSQGSLSSSLICSITTGNDIPESSRYSWKSMSDTSKVESLSFLNAFDVQIAGGAAGEYWVQVICSDENGWLFCGVYDGFNGRDAADFLAGTLYEKIIFYLHLLELDLKQHGDSTDETCLDMVLEGSKNVLRSGTKKFLAKESLDTEIKQTTFAQLLGEEFSSESFRVGVVDCLTRAFAEAESDFLYMVEQEMLDRLDLVCVGTSVLTIRLHGRDLYVLNVRDSRAVLATSNACGNGSLEAVQLTEIHTIDNEVEYKKVLADHPDDPNTIVGGRVKGKLQLTRAFGVGFLKKNRLNEALMGILRVQDLCSPPYVYNHPFTICHEVSENELFVVLGSYGLFDFIKNDEIVEIVHLFMQENPFGDPARHLVEQLTLRAAENAGFSPKELMRIPVGRRKYHDDVTVIVIILGNKQRTSTASASL